MREVGKDEKAVSELLFLNQKYSAKLIIAFRKATQGRISAVDIEMNN